MALTNYLAQGFIIAFVLFGVGPVLALAGRIGTCVPTAIVVIAFGAQMLASWWWLGRHEYGPRMGVAGADSWKPVSDNTVENAITAKPPPVHARGGG